mmetsp:Transcript_2327/g.2613  ORF Transcript_2327/g.2613 Transcript_2327/m.2613 type:complete len:100 (+) Transcript_2327:66-365(+)
MSNELANSIVLASQQMEYNEQNEPISVIRFRKYQNKKYYIQQPSHMGFDSFEECYNHMLAQGYREVNPEKSSRLYKATEIGNSSGDEVVMIMSKPVGKK